MGYATTDDVTMILAQTLTSATSSSLTTKVDLLNVGKVLDQNLVTEDILNNYIRFSDMEINGFLSVLYSVPICESVDVEISLFSPISEYNDYVVIDGYCPLNVGDTILLVSGDEQERHVIAEVIADDTYSVEGDIQYEFPEGSRVVRVKFPDPLPIMSARVAAASIYDKYFSAESAPNVTDYGNTLRDLASLDINSVLNGTIVFHGQHRTGRRFYNSTLDDQYGLPAGGMVPKEFKKLK